MAQVPDIANEHISSHYLYLSPADVRIKVHVLYDGTNIHLSVGNHMGVSRLQLTGEGVEITLSPTEYDNYGYEGMVTEGISQEAEDEGDEEDMLYDIKEGPRS